MYLNVDISNFIYELFYMLLGVLHQYFTAIDSVTILHRQGFTITLLDFTIGIVVVSIVLGAFLHINRPDDFYNDR